MTTDTVSEKLAAFVASLEIPQNSFQKQAYENLLQLDFPTTKSEYWKYTRVGKITSSKFQIPKEFRVTSDEVRSEIIASNYLVIENGVLRSDLSKYSINGVTVKSVKPENITEESSLNQNHIFTALNSTFFHESIEITVDAKTEMSVPLQLVFVTSGKNTFANPHIKITAQKFSSAKFVASFISRESENSFNNVITEFAVGENAILVYDKIQNESEANFHISTEEVSQEKNSNFKINTVTLDGTLVRNNINISVNGENCETHMNGVIIAKGNAHVDNHTFVNHKVANCFSNENYKYVLEDKSTGVFNGRVIVQQHAQKINAYQKNGNILLSDFAQIFSKPELEIYADDVKCSHGSTTGQLDENAIFYLQARGISKDKAKKLLVSAFVGEVIEQFSSDAMRDKINQVLVDKHNWTI
ncbi:MAG: Fe-S cluster assembly protein SufD [Crocinitomicaceae bacterium]|jgi:Fe-S cluster assembly protein SufD|nr:Fe-S cluster assembly protein SufD [Crocinitomicaceae bacterium]MBK6951359.1 Fe-S cluster assembly protein SufD [Crocinitomicaceae bacterium]